MTLSVLLTAILFLPLGAAEERTQTVTIDPDEFTAEKIDIDEGRVGYRVTNSSGDFDFYVYNENEFNEYKENGSENSTSVVSEKRISTIDSDVAVSDGPVWVVFENSEEEKIEMTYQIYYGSNEEIWMRGGICLGILVVFIIAGALIMKKWKSWSHRLADKIFGKRAAVKEKEELQQQIKELKEENERLRKIEEKRKTN